jgi:hypothetical protein
MLKDNSGQDLVSDISTTESKILEIENTKIHWWNVVGMVRKIKFLIGRFFMLVLDNFRFNEELHKTNADIIHILRMQQQQLDIINKKINGDDNGKSSDNYGS